MPVIYGVVGVALAIAGLLLGVVLGRVSFRRQLGRFVLQLDGQCRADVRAGKTAAIVEAPGITAAARAITARFIQ